MSIGTIYRNEHRVIALIDMDCFYVQVEELAAPEFRGKPCGVSQYNPYRGGGLIAVNYEARKFNVKRGMRGEEAKTLCPDFHIFYVQEKRGKADLTKYRDASITIFEIISKHCKSVEKASIDEAYLDLTDEVMERIRAKQVEKIKAENLPDSFVVGSYALDKQNEREENLSIWLAPLSDLTCEISDTFLAVGALIVQEIRKDILDTLGYHCSAGIAHNKTLAKLCCGINKPRKQTILPMNATSHLMDKTPIRKIKNLGGKLGLILTDEMGMEMMGDLAKLSLNELSKKFGEKTGTWLHQISHGVDVEQVMARQIPKSIGCSKNFRGKQALNTISKVQYWITQLTEELQERLESDKARNEREANLMVIQLSNEAGTFSKSTSINKYCAKRFQEQIMDLLKPFNKAKNEAWIPAIFNLGISASKFVDIQKTRSSNRFLKYFSKIDKSVESEEKENPNKIFESSLSDPTTPNTSLEKLDFEEVEVCQVVSDKPTTSKMVNSDDEIKSVENESSLSPGAENDVEIVAQVEAKKKIEDSKNKLNFFGQSKNRELNVDMKLDEVDYVRCEKCNKKILCWEMPEHEDFHFAKELSRQIDPDLAESVTTAKKRSIEETPPMAKSDENVKGQKSIVNVKSKKIKTNSSSDANKNAKSIENYFKKLN